MHVRVRIEVLCKYHLHLIAWSVHCFSLHIYGYMELKAGQTACLSGLNGPERTNERTYKNNEQYVLIDFLYFTLASIHFSFRFPFLSFSPIFQHWSAKLLHCIQILCIWSVFLFLVRSECCAWINPCWLKDTQKIFGVLKVRSYLRLCAFCFVIL